MVGQKNEKINQLNQLLPEGLVVDTPWLERHGYRRQWREKYVAQGWLQSVTRGVYRRPSSQADTTIPWQRIVISLQRLLEKPLHVGGRSALELHGLAHYLRLSGTSTVHLYAFEKLPGWTQRIDTDTRLIEHKANRLFDPAASGITQIEWGHWGWKLDLATPERALCELLDEVPDRESFHQADVLMESARTLSPRKVQAMLEVCKSVKVKRLFLWFADRHHHSWFDKLNFSQIDLGRGKRQIIPGGRFDQKYQITVPENVDAGG
jgi:Transcriptional regulator, AbiEi antitoxin, Type IV TA system/Transcriptional regulator, AbiEi antitoxin N-terminal domain